MYIIKYLFHMCHCIMWIFMLLFFQQWRLFFSKRRWSRIAGRCIIRVKFTELKYRKCFNIISVKIRIHVTPVREYFYTTFLNNTTNHESTICCVIFSSIVNYLKHLEPNKIFNCTVFPCLITFTIII